MNGTYLKFYVHEHRRHHGILLYEWLLHGVLHKDHFFELAGNLPVEVVFAVSDQEAEQLLEVIEKEKVRVFYLKMPVEYGVIGGE